VALRDVDRNRRLPLVISPKGLLALRGAVAAAVVVVWNVLMWLARWLNGGGGALEDPRALLVLLLATSGLGGFALFVVLSPRFRELVTAPSRRRWYESAPFVLVTVVSGGLALVLVGFMVGAWSPTGH
jgi:hypothetical protein